MSPALAWSLLYLVLSTSFVLFTFWADENA